MTVTNNAVSKMRLTHSGHRLFANKSFVVCEKEVLTDDSEFVQNLQEAVRRP